MSGERGVEEEGDEKVVGLCWLRKNDATGWASASACGSKGRGSESARRSGGVGGGQRREEATREAGSGGGGNGVASQTESASHYSTGVSQIMCLWAGWLRLNEDY